MAHAERIVRAEDLGRDRAGLDAALGSLAVVPLLGAALDVWLFGMAQDVMVALSIVWSGALLAFFGGVRRGLAFSEVGGGGVFELTTLLGLFALGVATLLFTSLLIAGFGFILLAILDVRAARRLEAPGYFKLFRPIQMTVAALALLALEAKAVLGP